jgi:hypothetical protein
MILLTLWKSKNVKSVFGILLNNRGNNIIIVHQRFVKAVLSQVLEAHSCNPPYSGGRDQEDQGLKPARANSFQDPISKIPNTK